MLTQRKPVIFSIHKINKNGSQNMCLNGEDKINFNNKKRLPWLIEEDEAIISFVEKYGTKNWTLVANKLGELFSNYNRTGKQCRERWHNHLDSNIKKECWTEKEEALLFMKHMEFGNKWSDIAKFLPGRTDNSIKNHFYSKLRKFIRKILKALHKDNLFKKYGIDSEYYTSDKIYKIIKNNNVPYNTLSKDRILDMILKNNVRKEKNSKILKKKFRRRKFGFVSLSRKKIERIKFLFRIKQKNTHLNRKGDDQENINITKNESQSNPDKYNEDSNMQENLSQKYQNEMISNAARINNNNIINDYIQPSYVNSVPNLNYNPAILNSQLNNPINIKENFSAAINQNILNDELFPQPSPTQPEFTVKLLERLSNLSNQSKTQNNKENNQDQSSINYFNFSGANSPHMLNELYTFNNRFFPQVNLNHNMSSFTLANNSIGINTIQENVIYPNNVSDIENQPYFNNLHNYDSPHIQKNNIYINNLMGTSSARNHFNNSVSLNYPLNANMEFIRSLSHGVNDNLKNPSFSINSDCIFHDANGLNINKISQKMNRSFNHLKSFNCLDADLLNDDSNISSILHNKSKLPNINTNTTQNMSMQMINTLLSYEGNHSDNFTNYFNMQNYLNMKNNNQSLNNTINNPSGNFNDINSITSLFNPYTASLSRKNKTQLMSPTKPSIANGLNISPRSAFVKNIDINTEVGNKRNPNHREK